MLLVSLSIASPIVAFDIKILWETNNAGENVELYNESQKSSITKQKFNTDMQIWETKRHHWITERRLRYKIICISLTSAHSG